MTNMQLMFQGGQLIPYTNTNCKYCGKPFLKTHNKICYCSDECRANALREQKAKYQRKRRKMINSGELFSNENQYIGTGFLSDKKRDNDEDELKSIRKEMKRLHLRRSIK